MPPYVHRIPFRIAMSEVDAAQIHFTAMYRWMDRGLSEWLAAVGYPFTRLLAEGPGVPIVDSHARFIARVLLDDEIVLTTHVGGIGTTSFETRHDFTRDDETVVEGRLVHVCIDRETRRPIPVPDWIREAAVADDSTP